MNDFLWWHFFLWWCFVFDPLPPYPYDGLLSLVLWRVNLWCRSLTVAGWIPSVSQVLISEMHCWQKVLELWVWSSVHVQDWSTWVEWHAGVSGWRFLLRVSGVWEDVFTRSIQKLSCEHQHVRVARVCLALLLRPRLLSSRPTCSCSYSCSSSSAHFCFSHADACSSLSSCFCFCFLFREALKLIKNVL